MSTGVTLFSEEELLEFVEYWGGDLSRLATNQLGRGRGLAALTFYLLHHPSPLPERLGWMHTVKQAVTYLSNHLHPSTYPERTFRTPECRAYFQRLFDGYLDCYGRKEVFRFRYQNWIAVDCPTMIDQLWTVQEMLKRAKG